MLIAGILIAGAAVAVVRGTRSTSPQAQPSISPTASSTASEAPTASPTESASETPSPSATMTFSGLPPFEQTGTPSPPAQSSGAFLPHTGTDEQDTAPLAALLLVTALGAGALLLRSEDPSR